MADLGQNRYFFPTIIIPNKVFKFIYKVRLRFNLYFRRSFAYFDCHPNRMLHINNKIIHPFMEFSSPNHIQVLIKRAQNYYRAYSARRYEQRKKVVSKRTKISTMSSTNLLISIAILHVQKC